MRAGDYPASGNRQAQALHTPDEGVRAATDGAAPRGQDDVAGGAAAGGTPRELDALTLDRAHMDKIDGALRLLQSQGRSQDNLSEGLSDCSTHKAARHRSCIYYKSAKQTTLQTVATHAAGMRCPNNDKLSAESAQVSCAFRIESALRPRARAHVSQVALMLRRGKARRARGPALHSSCCHQAANREPSSYTVPQGARSQFARCCPAARSSA